MCRSTIKCHKGERSRCFRLKIDPDTKASIKVWKKCTQMHAKERFCIDIGVGSSYLLYAVQKSRFAVVKKGNALKILLIPTYKLVIYT
mmetsp:Transcript_5274/g.11440  ORF Transcript_5274/g.11440 Transcript_5274/m.11440 type:complete len:88 (+) Transcript_5274:661-924(+)